MVRKVLAYYLGVVGVPGRGANLVMNYSESMTIGDVVQSLVKHGFKENNRRTEVLKHAPRDLNRVNPRDPHWSHATKLSDYACAMGIPNAQDIDLVYVCV